MFPASRQWLASLTLIVLAGAATYYMRLGPASTAAGTYFEQVINNDHFVFANSDIALRQTYTGIVALDKGLSVLVAAFLPGAAGLNKASQFQQVYFLLLVAPLIGSWSVEAARGRNKGSLITFTSIWALFYQTVGGAIIIPLWYLCFIFQTSKQEYWLEKDDIPTAKVRGLLLALILGYIIPTGIMYMPFLDIETQQLLIAFWQPSPIFVNILWYIFTKVIPSSETSKEDIIETRAYVNLIYATVIFVSAFTHVSVVVACLTSSRPDVGLSSVMLPFHRHEWTMDEALLFIFQIDFWVIFAAALTACYISIWDLSSLGLTTMGIWGGIFELSTVAVLLGPGAAVGLGWYWREKGMYQAAQKLKKT